MKTLSVALTFALALLTAAPASASDPDVAGINGVFETFKAALAKKDEAAAKAAWHPAGWAENLTGSSGLSGTDVYGQGSRKGWWVKPDVNKLRQASRGGPWIVPCLIWSEKKQRAVDGVDIVVVWHGDKWLLLGGGETAAQVDALANRWQQGEFAPKKKK